MKVLYVLPLVCLLGCSSRTRPAATPATPPPPPAEALVVIGNSITDHGPQLSIGWSGNWGMAASAQPKDFAHLSSQGLNLPITIINGAPAEQDPVNNGATVLEKLSAAITPRTLTVIELGDNVSSTTLAAFQPVYESFAQVASQGRGFVCLSTYWETAATDNHMRTSCTAHGGVWISIGDIFTDPNNPDYQGPPEFSTPGVERHPHDWSMQQIADRVIEASWQFTTAGTAAISQAKAGLPSTRRGLSRAHLPA